MKEILSLILCVLLFLCILVACGEDPGGAPSADPDDNGGISDPGGMTSEVPPRMIIAGIVQPEQLLKIVKSQNRS